MALRIFSEPQQGASYDQSGDPPRRLVGAARRDVLVQWADWLPRRCCPTPRGNDRSGKQSHVTAALHGAAVSAAFFTMITASPSS